MAKEKEYKLDIFQMLRAIDRRDKSYYSKLSEEERKGFAAIVALRWLGNSNDRDMAEFQVLLTNQIANPGFYDLSKHPELQYKLMAASGLGTVQDHSGFIPLARQKKQNSKVHDFLSTIYGQANQPELDFILNSLDRVSFESHVYAAGLKAEEEESLIDAYCSIKGIEVGRKKRKPKGK